MGRRLVRYQLRSGPPTFDAQYFGLAQRRRRVFGVFARRDIGAGGCGEILSLAEGVRGHLAPGREAGEGVAGTLTRGALDGSGCCGGDGRESFLVSGTLTSRPRGSVGNGTDFDLTGGLQVVAGTLSPGVHPGSYNGQDAYNDLLIPIAFSSKDHGGGQVAIAFSGRARGDDGRGYDRPPQVTGDKVGTLDTVKPWNVAFDLRGREGGAQFEGPHDTANIRAASGGSSKSYLVTHGVRRVTPRECERLQGFPDDWTAGFADSVRYRMLGNAVARPCSEWIARRMATLLPPSITQ